MTGRKARRPCWKAKQSEFMSTLLISWSVRLLAPDPPASALLIGPSQNHTALYWACGHGNEELVRALLAAEARPNVRGSKV
jgi:hypothetical protein